MKTSDQELLESIAKKDEFAFNEFYKKYASLLFKWVLNRTQNFDISSDVTQEFWTSLWIDPTLIKTNIVGSAKNYLLHFFTFRILDYLRILKKREKLDNHNNIQNNSKIEMHYSHVIEEIEEKEINEIMAQVLEKLPNLTTKIFIHRWHNNYSIKETATHFNVNEKTVYNRTFIAISAIRTKMLEIY